MSTTILSAPPYDPKRENRRKLIIAAVVTVILIIAGTIYEFRFLPQERIVDRFFDALQAKDYEKAYAIWTADPNWKQHPNAHPRYRYGDFYLDWGPGGEYGIVNSHHIDTAANPRHGGSGVIVQVTVNQRTKKVFIWVEKSDKTLSFSPFELR